MEEHQKSFDQMKPVMAKEALLTFPDFNKEFELHTDAGKLQLGAWISQKGKPVAMIKNDYRVQSKPISVRNPQANAIVERVHRKLAIIYEHSN